MCEMSEMIKGLPVLKCKRCGHEWYPRSRKKPDRCANKKCNSPYWDKERIKKKVK